MTWTLEFYRSPDGGAPVADWLDSLPPVEAARAMRGLDILRAFGTRIGMPHVRDSGETPPVFGLRWRGQPEHRFFYMPLSNERYLILHGCTKQAYGPPPEDSALARARQQEYLKRTGTARG
jgi:phage-related protein